MSWQTGGGWQDPLYILSLANTFTANQTISNTAPSLVLTDTTASAKSLTIAVDANLAQFRESAGAAGSLLVLDLANNRVGVGLPNPQQKVDIYNGNLNLSNNYNIGWGGSANPRFTGNASTGVLEVTSSTRVDFQNSGDGYVSWSVGALGETSQKGANGQKFVTGRKTELVAVGSGLSTKATTIQIPADAIIKAVPVYVKTKPGGTATMTVTATTSGTAFQKGANISTNAGTSDPGNKGTPVNYNGTDAQTVTFTFDAPTTDALGEIRVDVYYDTSTPATS